MVMFAGYALFGKGFAYIGYPPLLIGEITLLAGIAIIILYCGIGGILTTLPALILFALISLVVTHAVLDVRHHGLDALRDSVTVVYGIFAFLAIALVIDKPRRLTWIVAAFGSFAYLYGIVGGLLTYATWILGDVLPRWPSSDVPILFVRQGEAAVHLAGVAVFALLALRRYTRLWAIALGIGIVLVTPSRGAMLSCIAPIFVAGMLSGQMRRILKTFAVIAAILTVLFITDIEIPITGGRSLGPEQLTSNIESIVGSSSASNLDGTKQWRLRWWTTIVDYTINGPYFWTGKGFGQGLAETDGFVVGEEDGGPIVRSPHNVHMTILARTGVPDSLCGLRFSSLGSPLSGAPC